jgi:hypothetical protein
MNSADWRGFPADAVKCIGDRSKKSCVPDVEVIAKSPLHAAGSAQNKSVNFSLHNAARPACPGN